MVYLLFQLDHRHLTDSYSCETINPVNLTVEKCAKFLCLTMWACSIRSAWYARISPLENFCKACLSLCPVNSYGGLKEFVDVSFLMLASGGKKKILFGPYRIFDAGENEQLRSRPVLLLRLRTLHINVHKEQS